MESHRNIYKEKDSKRDDQKPLSPSEVIPAELQARARRHAILYTILMLAVLSPVLLYVYNQEQKEKKNEKAAKLAGTPITLTNQTGSRTIPSASIPLPQDEPYVSPLETQSPGPTADIAPEKMAEAMSELRAANDYLVARDFEQAEVHAQKALAIWPSMNAGLRMLGWIYVQRGQFNEAIVVLEKAMKIDPFNAEIYNNLATAYMQKRMLEKAEELLLASQQIRPDMPLTNLNLGLLYVVWGKFEQAIEYLETASQQLPDNPSVRNNLGVALIRLGRYEEARKHLQYLVDRSPTTPAAFFNMAITYTYERNTADAIAWIRKGVASCPPASAQHFLADTDFDSLRSTPEFQEVSKGLYPDVPKAPGPL